MSRLQLAVWVVLAFKYANDVAGRSTLRIDSAPTLSVTNAFAYNQRSEVTNAAMGAITYGYGYDDIGNRKWARLILFRLLAQ